MNAEFEDRDDRQVRFGFIWRITPVWYNRNTGFYLNYILLNNYLSSSVVVPILLPSANTSMV
jgi:hypothetical protein